MRRIALSTTLAIAASSSVVSAEPQRDRPSARQQADRDAYDRFEGSRWQREARWVPLARYYTAEATRQFVNVRGRGNFDHIRVEADRGAPVITQLAIEYVDGTVQKVRIDTRLSRGAGEVIRVRRDPGINRIIVYAEPGYPGAYSVYGG